MSNTRIPFGDSRAVKRWSAAMFAQAMQESVWRPLIGVGDQAQTPVVEVEDLKSAAGDGVTVNLAVPIAGEPVIGDDRNEGAESQLNMYTDECFIDLMTKPVDCGGLMTKKRTVVDLRQYAKAQLSTYFAEIHDELLFIYAAGARGCEPTLRWRPSFTGFANNPLTAPDANHIIYPGTVASAATMTTADVFDLPCLEVAGSRIKTLGGNASPIPMIRPIMINGKPVHVAMLHEWQLYSLRTITGEGHWLDLQKHLATANGEKNAIFTGAEAMHNGIVIRSHKNVVRFNNYGAGGNVNAARAYVMGRQALAVCYGDVGKGYAADWFESLENRGANPVITGRLMMGVKKLQSNGADVGMLSIDTAVTPV